MSLRKTNGKRGCQHIQFYCIRGSIIKHKENSYSRVPLSKTYRFVHIFSTIKYLVAVWYLFVHCCIKITFHEINIKLISSKARKYHVQDRLFWFFKLVKNILCLHGRTFMCQVRISLFIITTTAIAIVIVVIVFLTTIILLVNGPPFFRKIILFA